MAFWVLTVRWLHFIGEVDKSKIAYFKFLQGFMYQSYWNRFIFGWVIQQIIGWLFWNRVYSDRLMKSRPNEKQRAFARLVYRPTSWKSFYNRSVIHKITSPSIHNLISIWRHGWSGQIPNLPLRVCFFVFGPQKHVIVRNHHRSAWKLQTCSEHGNSRIASPKWLILGHTVMRKIRCGLFLPL